MRTVSPLLFSRISVATSKGIMGRRKATAGTTTSPPAKTSAQDKPSSSAVGKIEKYTFFWKIQSPFSQWYPATFNVDGVSYSCAEQYMMHQKAVLFHDEEMAKKILQTDKPKAMKAFGRKVKNFDANLWNAKCRNVVKKGNMAKFSQNPELKAKLFATKHTVMVEASPRDRIWGIGLSASNPKAQKKETWRGKNWLGYTLTDVRDELMAGSGERENETSATEAEQKSEETAQEQSGETRGDTETGQNQNNDTPEDGKEKPEQTS